MRAVVAGLLALLVATAARCGPPPGGGTPDDRPNLVVVLLDDLDETTTPYWDAMPRTRELIADRGLTFANAFANDPICCPARASILSGRYPHNTGVFDITGPDGGFAPFRDNESDTVATRLRNAGYETGFFGKYLAGTPASHVAPGWDDWFALTGNSFYDGYTYDVNHNGVIESYGDADADYQTDVIAREASAFVDDASGAKPFFLVVAPTAPHLPLEPARRDAGVTFAETATGRPNFAEPDRSDKPSWLRDGAALPAETLATWVQDDYRKRMGSLLAVDDMVAGLVARLEQAGELDNTIIMFTSDNGYNLGAHGLLAKQTPYDESIRVPLVITGPGVRTGSTDAVATHVDYAPTLLELARVEAGDLDGRSLVPLFTGDIADWRNDVLVEFHGTYGATSLNTASEVAAALDAGYGFVGTPPTYRALRTTNRLYVEWYAGTEHEYELYDLDADPYQLNNLLANGAERTETAALQQRLEYLAGCAGSSCRTP